jgi:pSer/pThr/pTyr-binding forkhead associated (FHA) protein
MSLQLNEIEKRLQNLIEVHLLKYLPGPSYQDRIAQRMAEALRTNFSTQSLHAASDSIPQQFLLVVHPSTMAQWQKDPRLMEGLTKIFRLVANEMGINISQPLFLTLAADPLIDIDNLDVRASKPEPIAETQNMFESLDETPTRTAFLIVGGTKVFSLDHAVTNIGRRLDNHLVVDDPRVSRYHAQIRYVRGRFIIFDLNSTGGTFVNGQRTTQSALYPGDVISLAGLPIVFGQDNPPSSGSANDTNPVPSVTNVDRKTAKLENPPRDYKEL